MVNSTFGICDTLLIRYVKINVNFLVSENEKSAYNLKQNYTMETKTIGFSLFNSYIYIYFERLILQIIDILGQSKTTLT